MPAQHPLPLSDMLCFALYSATHAMQSVYKPLLDDLGLTYPQYLVLVSLWGQDNQTVGKLGAALHLESNTLTPLLKRMEAAGHLTRHRNANDERQVQIRLTDQGRNLKARTQHLTTCIFDHCGLSLSAITDLQSRITTLRDHLRQP
jgi:MarR family transcriptional regulator, organic hydroperoxide resistance regulator